MKILFISMHSVHAIRWMQNLKKSSYELFWYDITNQGSLNLEPEIIEFSSLQKRKLPYLKGEFFLSKKMPELFRHIRPILEKTENEILESIILKIQPDIVHSFEMQTCSYPIVKTMWKFPKIKWVYSCWGNDLYYYQNLKSHVNKIRNVLKRVNFIHTDCERDFLLAQNLGFKGIHLGVIPGGAGYKIDEYQKFKIPIIDRRIILVKGYQHLFGRALNVVKALQDLKENLESYRIVVFGAHSVVFDYIVLNNLDYEVYGRHELSQIQLLKIMGKSLVYIGNSISDGIPNTMLEAIVMGAFPIQSNPGGASAEIIQNGVNGYLIDNAADIDEIKIKIMTSLNNTKLMAEAAIYNKKLAIERLDFQFNKTKIVEMYDIIMKS